MHLKKRLSLLAVAAVAAGLAVPASASATTGGCSFVGVAGQITPGVMLAGGSGTYNFATVDPATTQCHVGAQQPRNSIIRSTGSFDNIVCGTGEARSQWQQRTAERTSIDYGADGLGTGAGPDIREAEYTITFAGAQGALDIETVGLAVNQALPETLPMNGRVTIVPSAGSCAAATGVTAFTVQGNFAANWSGLP